MGLEIDNSKRGIDALQFTTEVGGKVFSITSTTDSNGNNTEVKGKFGSTDVALDRNGDLKLKYGNEAKAQVGIDLNKLEINKIGFEIKGTHEYTSGDSTSIGVGATTNIVPIKLKNLITRQSSISNENSSAYSRSTGECGSNMTCLNPSNKLNTACGVYMSCVNQGR